MPLVEDYIGLRRDSKIEREIARTLRQFPEQERFRFLQEWLRHPPAPGYSMGFTLVKTCLQKREYLEAILSLGLESADASRIRWWLDSVNRLGIRRTAQFLARRAASHPEAVRKALYWLRHRVPPTDMELSRAVDAVEEAVADAVRSQRMSQEPTSDELTPIHSEEFRTTLELFTEFGKDADFYYLLALSKSANPIDAERPLQVRGHNNYSQTSSETVSALSVMKPFFRREFVKLTSDTTIVLTEKGRAFCGHLEDHGYIVDSLNGETFTPLANEGKAKSTMNSMRSVTGFTASIAGLPEYFWQVEVFARCPKCGTEASLGSLQKSEGTAIVCPKCDFRGVHPDVKFKDAIVAVLQEAIARRQSG
jgi:DNA-directed RNA polymerase subunit RPC12/RpoP